MYTAITKHKYNMDINEKQALRYKFLNKLYDLTEGNGDPKRIVIYTPFASELGIDKNKIHDIVLYLANEGLLEKRTRNGIRISHSGIKEIEEARSNPGKGTEHFPPINVIHVQSMTNSVIQQNSTNAIQNVKYHVENREDIASFIEELKSSLDSLNLATEEQNEILAEINTVNAQVDSPKPKTIILGESLKTIKAILESVAANAMTPGLLEKLNMILGAFGG